LNEVLDPEYKHGDFSLEVHCVLLRVERWEVEHGKVPALGLMQPINQVLPVSEHEELVVPTILSRVNEEAEVCIIVEGIYSAFINRIQVNLSIHSMRRFNCYSINKRDAELLIEIVHRLECLE
jgi:hypothetical protein